MRRGTRAGHILVGILIMVTLYGLALWAGLEALRALLAFIDSTYSNAADLAGWDRTSLERSALSA